MRRPATDANVHALRSLYVYWTDAWHVLARRSILRCVSRVACCALCWWELRARKRTRLAHAANGDKGVGEGEGVGVARTLTCSTSATVNAGGRTPPCLSKSTESSTSSAERTLSNTLLVTLAADALLVLAAAVDEGASCAFLCMS